MDAGLLLTEVLELVSQKLERGLSAHHHCSYGQYQPTYHSVRDSQLCEMTMKIAPQLLDYTDVTPPGLFCLAG
jgi:hypothetical protein